MGFGVVASGAEVHRPLPVGRVLVAFGHRAGVVDHAQHVEVRVLQRVVVRLDVVLRAVGRVVVQRRLHQFVDVAQAPHLLLQDVAAAVARLDEGLAAVVVVIRRVQAPGVLHRLDDPPPEAVVLALLDHGPAYMRVAADDFNQSSRLKVTEYVAGEVIDAIDRLTVAVRRCGESRRGPVRGVATLHQGHPPPPLFRFSDLTEERSH